MNWGSAKAIEFKLRSAEWNSWSDRYCAQLLWHGESLVFMGHQGGTFAVVVLLTDGVTVKLSKSLYFCSNTIQKIVLFNTLKAGSIDLVVAPH